MNFDDLVRQTNDAAQASREAVNPQQKENAYYAFLDAAIDFFNETMTGDVKLADGRTVFIPAIAR